MGLLQNSKNTQKAATFKTRGKTELLPYFYPKAKQDTQPTKKTESLLPRLLLSFSGHARAVATWVAVTHTGLCALGGKGLVNEEIIDALV